MPSAQRVIDQLRDEGELPIFYHQAAVSEVIKNHPDQKKLNERFLMDFSKTLEKDFREANSQIRETKLAFNLPAAKGFILVTNSELPEITTQLAWNELNRLITRKRGKAFAYEHIEFAIYIQDVEVREITNHYAEHPVLTISREENKDIQLFIDKLLRAIAEAKGFSFLEFEGNTKHLFDALTPHKRFKNNGGPLTRSALWKKHYLKTRSHRQLSDEDLLRKLARFILEEFLILKDEKIAVNTEAPNRDHFGATLEGLFTECELRNLDMRKMQQQMHLLLDQRLVTSPVAEFLMRRRTAATK